MNWIIGVIRRRYANLATFFGILFLWLYLTISYCVQPMLIYVKYLNTVDFDVDAFGK